MLPSFFDPIGMSALRMFLNGWKFSLSLVAFSLMFAAQAATAGELIMYEQDGCYNCDLWKKEVGKIYPLTDEARILPLRMVDIHGPQPKDLEFLGPIRFTPYFAIIEKKSLPCLHMFMKMRKVNRYHSASIFFFGGIKSYCSTFFQVYSLVW